MLVPTDTLARKEAGESEGVLACVRLLKPDGGRLGPRAGTHGRVKPCLKAQDPTCPAALLV